MANQQPAELTEPCVGRFDDPELKQELGLGHFEGPGWRRLGGGNTAQMNVIFIVLPLRQLVITP
jgi:hypothetical protein